MANLGRAATLKRAPVLRRRSTRRGKLPQAEPLLLLAVDLRHCGNDVRGQRKTMFAESGLLHEAAASKAGGLGLMIRAKGGRRSGMAALCLLHLLVETLGPY